MAVIPVVQYPITLGEKTEFTAVYTRNLLDLNWFSDRTANYARNRDGHQGEVVGSLPASTGVTDNLPIAMPAVAVGINGGYSYGSLHWYNRIHFDPLLLSFGNLTSDQVRNLVVWNAYESPNTLQSITVVGGDGVILTEPAPTPLVFNALEEKTYSFSISLTGPAALNATYTFTFDTEVKDFVITGNRVVLLTAPIDWEEPVKERVTFNTKIIRAFNGSEQRIKYMEDPRRRIEYRYLLNERRAKKLRAQIWGWQGRIFGFPVWVDVQFLSSQVSAGATTLTVDTTNYEFRGGGLVMLIAPDGTIESAGIDTVSVGSLLLDSGLVNTFPANSRVLPVYSGRIKEPVSLVQETDNLYSVNIALEVQESNNRAAVEGTNTHLSYAVFPWRPNWVSPPSDSYQRLIDYYETPEKIESIANEKGDYPESSIEMEWLVSGRDEIKKLREWIEFRKGRLVPFFLPSWTNDFTQTLLVGAGDSTLEVEDDGYVEYYEYDVGKQEIAFIKKDNTVVMRHITGVTKGTTDREVIAFTPTAGEEFTVGSAMISLGSLVRFASDSIEIVYESVDVATVRSVFKVIQA